MSPRGLYRRPADACRPPGTPSTSRNTCSARCPPAAELRDARLAAQSFEDNADLLFGGILPSRRARRISRTGLLGAVGSGGSCPHRRLLGVTMSPNLPYSISPNSPVGPDGGRRQWCARASYCWVQRGLNVPRATALATILLGQVRLGSNCSAGHTSELAA